MAEIKYKSKKPEEYNILLKSQDITIKNFDIKNFDSNFITNGKYDIIAKKDSNYNFHNFDPVYLNNIPTMLGQGTFSTIYLYKNKLTQKLFAVKHIYKNKILETIKTLSKFKEIEIHKKLIHDNIIRLYSSRETKDYYDLLLEYAPKGNIFQLILQKQNFSEIECFSYFIQIVNAIYFLHENNIIHRDIKPENILLFEKNKIKLCDFGWSTYIDINNRTSICGAFEYMSPEMINGQSYNKSTDIWSLGILLYEMYFGFPPFIINPQSNDKTNEIFSNILNKKISFDCGKEIDKNMKNLILKMLEKKNKKRFCIKDILIHPWVKKFEYVLFGSVEMNINNKKDICKMDIKKDLEENKDSLIINDKLIQNKNNKKKKDKKKNKRRNISANINIIKLNDISQPKEIKMDFENLNISAIENANKENNLHTHNINHEFFGKKHLDNTNIKNKSSKYLYESDKKNFDNFKLDININSNDFISDFNNRPSFVKKRTHNRNKSLNIGRLNPDVINALNLIDKSNKIANELKIENKAKNNCFWGNIFNNFKCG